MPGRVPPHLTGFHPRFPPFVISHDIKGGGFVI